MFKQTDHIKVNDKLVLKNNPIKYFLGKLLPSMFGKPTHMAVGTGTPSSTALGTENDRNALSTKTRSNAVVTMVGDWAAGDATAALTEAGVFDASSSGNMWLSSSYSVINKGANDTLQITWTFTIS